jgi:hypothetical protein
MGIAAGSPVETGIATAKAHGCQKPLNFLPSENRAKQSDGRGDVMRVLPVRRRKFGFALRCLFIPSGACIAGPSPIRCAPIRRVSHNVLSFRTLNEHTKIDSMAASAGQWEKSLAMGLLTH